MLKEFFKEIKKALDEIKQIHKYTLYNYDFNNFSVVSYKQYLDSFTWDINLYNCICSILIKLFDLKGYYFKIKNFILMLKWGFHPSEIWNLDYTIASFSLKRLKKLKENLGGFPMGFESIDDWEKVIDKMIFSFTQIIEDDLQNDEKIEEGLLLFGKYFRALWN